MHAGQHLFQMRLHLPRLHAAHPGVTAQRNAGGAVFGFTVLETDVRAGKADHELGDAHAEQARCQVMAPLVNEHEEAQDKYAADDGEKKSHFRPLQFNLLNPGGGGTGPPLFSRSL